MSRIAFIGLGNMGLPMAINLAKAGHVVTGFDIVETARAAFAPHGRVALSIPEAVAESRIIMTMLPVGVHVREAYAGKDGVFAHAAPGSLLIDCSTIDVATARDIAAMASGKGFAMLDAPVSGGVGGAAAGTLTFMVGGSEDAFAAARPVLAAMGGSIVHCGDSGAGQSAKICNNMILGISMIAVSEAFALADRLGLDRGKLFEVASKSSGQCWSLTSYCPAPGLVATSPANRDWTPGFSASLMLKDLRLSQMAALESGASTKLGAAAAEFYDEVVRAGRGHKDFSYAYKFLAELDGND
jgi:3-hydroxyisobutyrate dehydrogenase